MSNKERLAVLSPLISTNQAFNDVPFQAFYPDFDQLFPDSRFVLTRRDSESWWRSVSRHWGLAEAPHQLDSLEDIQYNQHEPYLYQATLDDKDVLIAKYEEHNHLVLQYFKHRPDDLLIIEWNNGEHGFSWEKLCAFLGTTMPEDTSVPWLK